MGDRRIGQNTGQSSAIFPTIGLTLALAWLFVLTHGGPIPGETSGTATPTLIANESSVIETKSLAMMKRSVEDDFGGPSSEDDDEETRDPYQKLISKKSSKVLNQLVAALQNSLGPNVVRTSDFLSDKELIPVRSSPNYELVKITLHAHPLPTQLFPISNYYHHFFNSQFNLQRRNQKDRKNYLRCYFNAVSCF